MWARWTSGHGGKEHAKREIQCLTTTPCARLRLNWVGDVDADGMTVQTPTVGGPLISCYHTAQYGTGSNKEN